jgi:hypothetical protein
MSMAQVDLNIAGGIHSTSPFDDTMAIVSRNSLSLVSALKVKKREEAI